MDADRRAQLRRGADGGDRAAPRDLSRPAQRRLHARFRCFRSHFWTSTSRPAVLHALPPERRRGAGLRADPSRRRRRHLPGWASRGGAGASSTSSTAAIADHSGKVCVIAYDLTEPEVVSRLKKLGKRLRIIVDDNDAHGGARFGGDPRWQVLYSAGEDNVRAARAQPVHTIPVVDGPKGQDRRLRFDQSTSAGAASTSSNALVLPGVTAVAAYHAAFRGRSLYLPPKAFGDTASGANLDRPRPAGYRRPGSRSTALRLERPARNHRRRPRHALDLVVVPSLAFLTRARFPPACTSARTTSPPPPTPRRVQNLLRMRPAHRGTLFAWWRPCGSATTTTSGSLTARPRRRASRSCSESLRANPCDVPWWKRGTTRTSTGFCDPELFA